MRMIVDLLDEAVEVYQRLAAERGIGLGQALTDCLWMYAGILSHLWRQRDVAACPREDCPHDNKT